MPSLPTRPFAITVSPALIVISAFGSAVPVTLVESVFSLEIVVSSIPSLITVVSAIFDSISPNLACAVTTVPACCFSIVTLYLPSLPTRPLASSVSPTRMEIVAFGSASPLACVDSVVRPFKVVSLIFWLAKISSAELKSPNNLCFSSLGNICSSKLLLVDAIVCCVIPSCSCSKVSPTKRS